MKNRIKYIIGLLVIAIGFAAGTNAFSANASSDIISAVTSAPPAQTEPVTQDTQTKQTTSKPVTTVVSTTNPLSIVNKPSAYLNKKVNMTARFDKFATLGLDYKPAMRSSETYISFLIFRPDTDKNIPLSEMKLFVTRKTAEKFIDLKEGDIVNMSGTVFSNALGDAWIDIDTLSKVNKETKEVTK